jgi:predicted peptidase
MMQCLHRVIGLLGMTALLSCTSRGEHRAPRTVPFSPSARGFITKEVQVLGQAHKYSLFVPPSYRPTRRYPALVFLHGVGEAGRDGVAPTTVGIGTEIERRNDNFPFIVIFPQSSGRWSSDEAGAIAIAALDDAMRHYSIDPQRVSLTGVSTGGKGTWMIGAAYRNRFAALIPLCGYSAYAAVPKLLTIPIWSFHYGADPVVSASNSRKMYEKIHSAGGNATYTEYDGFSHFVWTKAYARDDLWQWVLSQRLSPDTRAGANGSSAGARR